MLKRSTLLLSAGLVVASAVLAGLWQARAPAVSPAARKPAAAAEAPREAVTDKGQVAVRSVYPGLVAGAPRPQRAPEDRRSAPAAERTSSVSAGTGTLPGSGPPAPSTNPAPEASSAGPNPATGPVAGVPRADEGLVDLNSASVEDLNRLGAGMIGRRIVGGRPYSSPEDLVSRRVLTRADFDRIKARAVVQVPPAAAP